MPGATSGIIFNEARLPNRALTTRDHTIGIVASINNYTMDDNYTMGIPRQQSGLVTKI